MTLESATEDYVVQIHYAVCYCLPQEEEYLIDVCSNEVEKSDVFLCLLGSTANKYACHKITEPEDTTLLFHAVLFLSLYRLYYLAVRLSIDTVR